MMAKCMAQWVCSFLTASSPISVCDKGSCDLVCSVVGSLNLNLGVREANSRVSHIKLRVIDTNKHVTKDPQWLPQWLPSVYPLETTNAESRPHSLLLKCRGNFELSIILDPHTPHLNYVLVWCEFKVLASANGEDCIGQRALLAAGNSVLRERERERERM